MLAEFKLDYNQRHFVRNETFSKAAEKIQVGLPRLDCGCAELKHQTLKQGMAAAP